MATLKQITNAAVHLKEEGDKLDQLKAVKQSLQDRAAAVSAQLAIAGSDVQGQRAVVDQAKADLLALLAEEET